MPARVAIRQPEQVHRRPSLRLAHPRILDLVQEPLAHLHVGPRIEEDAVARQPVPPRASDLLIPRLDVRRHVAVDDEAHVRLVDPHPEGDRRDHDVDLVPGERLLVVGARLVVESRVVGHRVHALAAQELGHLLDGLPRQAVDDAALPPVAADEPQNLGPRVPLPLLPAHDAQVRTEEGPLEPLGPAHAELAQDVGGDRPRGRGRECEDRQPFRLSSVRVARHVGPCRQNLVAQAVKRPVGGAEVVSPLGDAMRLVHDDDGDGRAPQPPAHVGREGLRRQVDEFVGSALEAIEPTPAFVGRERGVDRGGSEAEVAQRVHLVLHETDQGGEDDDRPRHEARGDLEGERLPRSGGHDADAVPTREHRVDDVRLSRPELVVAEHVAEHGFRSRLGGAGLGHRGQHTTDVRTRLNGVSTARKPFPPARRLNRLSDRAA